MKIKSNPTQFELAVIAMMFDGTHEPAERVKLAMAVWDEAGEKLFPESEPCVAVSLDQLLKKLFPDVGNGKKSQTVKELNAARMGKYRKFLEWREWARRSRIIKGASPMNETEGRWRFLSSNPLFERMLKPSSKFRRRMGFLALKRLRRSPLR